MLVFHRMTIISAAFLTVLSSTTRSEAQVRFINLSNQRVFGASYTYLGSQPPVWAGNYNLPMIQEQGWTFRGWAQINPGATFESAPGNYYLETVNGPIWWTGLPTSPGLVRLRQQPFSVFVSKARWAEEAGKLLSDGYKVVQFQRFDRGVYVIK